MTNPRCFIDAAALWRTSGPLKISDEEYLDYMLEHFQGARHPYDTIKGDVLSLIDPFADSLRSLIFDNEATPVDDTSIYHKLFISCMRGDYNDAVQCFALIKDDATKPSPLQSLACLAALQSNTPILKYCLDAGAVFNNNLDRSTVLGVTSAAMLDLLYQANWRNMQNSQATVNEFLTAALDPRRDILDWLLEHGARPDAQKLRSASRGDFVISRLARLVEMCGGVQILEGCGAVEEAARLGDLEKLEYLIGGGLNVHLDGRSAALYLAVEEDRLNAVKFLLEHGAKVRIEGKRRYETQKYESPLQLSRRLGNQPVLDLVEEWARRETDNNIRILNQD